MNINSQEIINYHRNHTDNQFIFFRIHVLFTLLNIPFSFQQVNMLQSPPGLTHSDSPVRSFLISRWQTQEKNDSRVHPSARLRMCQLIPQMSDLGLNVSSAGNFPDFANQSRLVPSAVRLPSVYSCPVWTLHK